MKSATHDESNSAGLIAALFAFFALAGCHGGAVGFPDGQPMIPPSYTIGGTVSGLAGSRLVLESPTNCCGQLIASAGAVTAPNGTFAVPADSALGGGTTYDVTVVTQPTNPSQTCVVANGTGTVGNSNVTNISVTCATNPARYLYVANFGSNDVSAFTINTGTGALATVPGSPFPAGNSPDSIAVDPTGRFAYVSNQTDSTVSAFTIDRGTGALQAVTGSPFATGPGPTSVAIDPS